MRNLENLRRAARGAILEEENSEGLDGTRREEEKLAPVETGKKNWEDKETEFTFGKYST